MLAFIAIATAVAMTLSPPSASEAVPRVPAQRQAPLMYDRISITERTIDFARKRVRATSRAMRSSAATQTLTYKTIRFVGNEYSRAIDLNNSGQILFTEESTTILPPYIADANGNQRYLSSIRVGRQEFTGTPTALSDLGGVAGNFFLRTSVPSTANNLAWQRAGTAYDVLYFDGWDFGAMAFGINDYDLSVGISGSTDPKHVQQASLFGPKYHRHALLPTNDSCGSSAYSYALGINDAGAIVGYEDHCRDGVLAVRYSMFGYAKTILPTSGYGSVAEAVNKRGDITGFGGPPSINTSAGRAFLYRSACDCVSYLPRPAGESNGAFYALAVNARDQVVGNIVDPNDEFNAPFLFSDGRTYDLNALLPPNSGWTLDSAIAVNDAGEIIGSGDYTDPSTGVFYGNVPFAMKP